jgi:hypothetical protein
MSAAPKLQHPPKINPKAAQACIRAVTAAVREGKPAPLEQPRELARKVAQKREELQQPHLADLARR